MNQTISWNRPTGYMDSTKARIAAMAATQALNAFKRSDIVGMQVGFGLASRVWGLCNCSHAGV